MNIRARSILSVWLMLIAVASAQAVDWPYYTSDLGGTKYSPADQIGPDNFDQLRVVWRFRPPDQQIYETAERDLDFDEHRGTPIAVNGVLYYASPFNILVAHRWS